MTVFAGLFEVVAGVTVAWFLVLLFARDLVFGLLGASSAFVVNTSFMGALTIMSGLLLLHHFRSFPYEDRERKEWAGTELFYANVFFITLFIFAISVAPLFLAG